MTRALLAALRRWWLGYRIRAAREYLRSIDDTHPQCAAIWAGHLPQIAQWEIERGQL